MVVESVIPRKFIILEELWGVQGVRSQVLSMYWKRIRHKVCAFSNRSLFIFSMFSDTTRISN
jgi:hypothetical protein